MVKRIILRIFMISQVSGTTKSWYGKYLYKVYGISYSVKKQKQGTVCMKNHTI